MRHRITSFRAVEPKSPPLGSWGGAGKTASPPCSPTYLCAPQQQDLRSFFLQSSSPLRAEKRRGAEEPGSARGDPALPSAAILDHPAQLGPAGQVERRVSGDFQHEPAPGEGDRIEQRIACGQPRAHPAGRIGRAVQHLARAGRGHRQRRGAGGASGSPQNRCARRPVAAEPRHRRTARQAIARGRTAALLVPAPGPRRGRRIAPVGRRRRGRRRRRRGARGGAWCRRRGRRHGHAGGEQRDEKSGGERAICLHCPGME